MRILLLVSAFNGLTQRVWCELRGAGHEVGVLFATGERDMIDGVRSAAPELIVCPFLKQRVPREIWQRHRTVIIHPGPVGDRGPSSLDWSISDGAPTWGVTALQAAQDMDAGPVWATRLFTMPDPPVRKSALYNGPVADAAVQCVLEVVAKADDPAFIPAAAQLLPNEVPEARLRPAMTQADRAFDWSEPTEGIVRTIRAADGSPGVRTRIDGVDVFAYDAHPGQPFPATPGRLLARRMHAVQVATGDGSVWLGHLRRTVDAGRLVPVKLPARRVLPQPAHGVARGWRTPVQPFSTPLSRGHGLPDGLREITYRRSGTVGWLTINFYNGAMDAEHCRRLVLAVRHATDQDTRVLVLRSTPEMFSNGIDLNSIEAASDPAPAAWDNIRAINQVCRQLITGDRQFMIAAYAGNAGAGGVMLGLGADLVAARAGIVLNPYYDIGLYGSELHTFTLPRRVGVEPARGLLADKLPVTAEQAAGIGLVDAVGPREPDEFTRWLGELANQHSDPRAAGRVRQARPVAGLLPLDAYESRELAEMSRDLFDDRNGFAAARHAFVTHAVAPAPDRLRMPATTMIASHRGRVSDPLAA